MNIIRIVTCIYTKNALDDVYDMQKITLKLLCKKYKIQLKQFHSLFRRTFFPNKRKLKYYYIQLLHSLYICISILWKNNSNLI